MSECGFSYAHYREILAAAARHHAFVSFDAALAHPGPFVLLRHDVDLSLEAALAMARIEAELGVAASYFLLPHAHYNLFGEPGFPIVEQIVALGHRLGLHYDLGYYERVGLDPVATLRWEADALAARFGVPVSVAARHKPGLAAGSEEFDPAPLLDAYAPAFTRAIRYQSESCQFWREGCPCRRLAAAAPERLQLLIHPDWWSEDGARADRILDAWAARRQREAEADAERECRYFASLGHLGNRHLFDRRTRG